MRGAVGSAGGVVHVSQTRMRGRVARGPEKTHIIVAVAALERTIVALAGGGVTGNGDNTRSEGNEEGRYANKHDEDEHERTRTRVAVIVGFRPGARARIYTPSGAVV